MRSTTLAVLAILLLPHAVRAADDSAKSDSLTADLSAWREPHGKWQAVSDVSLNADDPKRLSPTAGAGAIYNGPDGRTNNLLTKDEFGDVEVHVEFCISKGSNSGVYLMGRYEVQIYDSFGKDKDQYPGIECGGLYPRWIDGKNVDGHSPRVNASKPPGQWQSFDITFRAPRFDRDGKKIANATFVKVIHNGQVIHENVEISGPTRAAAFEHDEKPTGPLMLQGDHAPVAFRNIRIRSVTTPAK